MNNIEIIKSNFEENQKINTLSSEHLLESIANATQKILAMLKNSGTLLTCGNGGSSGDAQHIASEFINRFEIERKSLPAVSLNSDTATITSISNDYGYKYVFSKQISAIGTASDILMPFTTSGNSENILDAISTAKAKGMSVILISGCDGGKAIDLLDENDFKVIVPSNRTSRIQEIHLIIIHSICECIDSYLST
tara:strand:- start:10 stop:594 length:585 start_codon:yes stop_codon:yes gene_type:complete